MISNIAGGIVNRVVLESKFSTMIKSSNYTIDTKIVLLRISFKEKYQIQEKLFV